MSCSPFSLSLSLSLCNRLFHCDFDRRSALMGLLSTLTRGLIRGADRMSAFTSKRGPKSNYKGRGARPAGRLTCSGKFVPVREMIPEFVVPSLQGFNLKPYVSYRAPGGTEPALTTEMLFNQTVAPHIKRDIEEGTFDKNNLEKYGLDPEQKGKLFKLHPKNFVR